MPVNDHPLAISDPHLVSFPQMLITGRSQIWHPDSLISGARTGERSPFGGEAGL
jgi:hypothetical protein